MKFIAGNNSLLLANKVGKYWGVTPIVPMVRRFSGNEIELDILESVEGEEVFFIQSICSPVNEHLMELLISLDCIKRSLARRITAIIPYLGYSRQDRRSSCTSSLAAKLVADMVCNAGADVVITVDLHSEQIEGFFSKQIYNLNANSIFASDIRKNFDLQNIALVAPDIGSVKRCKSLGEVLRLENVPVVINKIRNNVGKIKNSSISGEVSGKDCIIVDDILDSGFTLVNAVEVLLKNGAKSVSAYVTHGVLSENSIDKVNVSGLERLVVTDSINVEKKIEKHEKIKVLSIAQLIAESVGNKNQNL